ALNALEEEVPELGRGGRAPRRVGLECQEAGKGHERFDALPGDLRSQTECPPAAGMHRVFLKARLELGDSVRGFFLVHQVHAEIEMKTRDMSNFIRALPEGILRLPDVPLGVV